MAFLQLETVSVHFGGLAAVSNLDLAVPAGSIHGLIGPNGSGKTTVFNVITGIYRANRGRILFRGEEISGLKAHEISGRGISRTFQNIELFPTLTVEENLLVGMHRRMRAGVLGAAFRSAAMRREERRAREASGELLEFLGLQDQRHAPSTSLPFGKQRLLELGRALATQPRLLLLDEPAAGMNARETEELEALVRRICRDRNVGILLVEHDMRFVMRIVDSVTVLNFGEKIAAGSPEAVRSDAKVIEAYLGKRKRRPGRA